MALRAWIVPVAALLLSGCGEVRPADLAFNTLQAMARQACLAADNCTLQCSGRAVERCETRPERRP